jgi:PAS domain S-box-containing protein
VDLRFEIKNRGAGQSLWRTKGNPGCGAARACSKGDGNISCFGLPELRKTADSDRIAGEASKMWRTPAAGRRTEIEIRITALLEVSRLKTADLLSSDSLFQNAFEFAAIGMALVSPEGKWLRVNRAVCEITGYSEVELLKRTFQQITHPDDLDLDLANVKKLLSGNIRSYQMEKRYLHKKGATVWVLLSVSLVRNKSGEPLFFIAQIQDITRQKTGEQELARATAEIKKLQDGLLKVCTWTKRIQVDGAWIPIDEFLTQHLHLKIAPGMSVHGGRMFDGK